MEKVGEQDAGMNSGNLRVMFVALWAILLVAKLMLAATLPLLIDESFYAWEGRFPAWAYSDLPGLTAFLAHIGTSIGGQHALALRAPFLLLGASVPWLVVRVSRRWFGARVAWSAGMLALLMPLSGLLGVLALPDVPLVLAALLCLDAIGSLRERVSRGPLAVLALALAIGALAHYRFALVIAAGLVGLLCDRRGRQLLGDGRVWLALAIGALGWLPLIAWNLGHGGVGLRFQLLDRNPWSFHADGVAWIAVQFLLVTPTLFVLLLATIREGWRRRTEDGHAPWALMAGVASVSVLGYFLLGFFVDDTRVSFHWPLSGWLGLIVAAPVILMRWRPVSRVAVIGGAGLGMGFAMAFLVAASQASLRQALADSRAYPADFAGRQEISDWVRQLRIAPTEALVTSDFALAAALVFALDRPDIQVLDSPQNHKHGRAAQLDQWGLIFKGLEEAGSTSVSLIVDDTATPMKNRLAVYHELCAVFGQLPRPSILSVDHGRQRYLLYRFSSTLKRPGCSTPALAYIDSPAARASVPPRFTVAGWAFKDGAGLAGVAITIDGEPIATARYGRSMPNVSQYWRVSTDPGQPNVGFDAEVDASALPPGKHWLGLRLYAADGSYETWAEQPVQIQPR